MGKQIVIKKYNFSVLKIENSGNGNSGIKIIFRGQKNKIVVDKISLQKW